MNTYKILNPYNKCLIAEITYTRLNDVIDALGLLEVGKKIQSKTAPFERLKVLEKLAQLIHRDKEKIARQITQEMGKTITESLVEVDRAICTFTLSAQESIRIKGEVLNADAYPPKKNKRGLVEYFPVGLVLAITPFNFPLNLAAHKIGPAYAAGNVILFKPAPQNYLSAKMLSNLCYEAGMTKENFQLINPDIATMQELVKDQRINCISFTGGVIAAKAIAQNAGLKKLLFELGGNDPLIIMPDGDIHLAVKTAINQRFGTAGQRCTASKKLFIHQDIYDEFKNILITESKKLVIGDPGEKETFLGPVVNQSAADLVMKRIQAAVDKGAKLLLGGKNEGNIIYPTILEEVSDECDLIKDETFGPVIPLKKFENIDDVINSLKQSSFGLQAGVFTNDLRIIKQLYAELEVGALVVNDGPGFRVEHFPFGGVKESGLGREGVSYAIQEMSVLKTLIF